MPRSPLPTTEYDYDTDRIINRYYPQRVSDIREDLAFNRTSNTNSYNISSFMMSLISMIHYFEEDAKELGMVFGESFFGISGTDLSKWFEDYANKETIYDNLYRLTRIRMIFRVQINNEFYYRVNDEDFICQNGVYLYKYNKGKDLENLFLGYCDICHYCNYKADRCNFLDIFAKKLISISGCPRKEVVSSDVYRDLEKKISRNKTNFNRISSYEKQLEKEGIPIKELTEHEKYHYHKKINESEENEKTEVVKELKIIVEKRRTRQKNNIENAEDYQKIVKKIDDQTQTRIIVDEWGFNPLMMSILNVINLGKEDSKILNIKFPGFSMYHIEKMLDGLWISNETIYDNLYKLQRMNLIKKIYYDEDEKPKNTKNEFYFKLNESRFLCVGGIYLFYYPRSYFKYKIFNGVCPHHHFCTDPRCSETCSLIRTMKNIGNMINENHTSDLVMYLTQKMEEWKKDFMHYELYKENLSTIIQCNVTYINNEIERRSHQKRVENVPTISTEDIMSKLTEIEILYYGKGLTDYYENDTKYRKLIDGISETIALVLTREIKKKKKQNKTKKKQKKIKTDMDYTEFLKSLILTPKKDRINLN